LFSGSSDKKLNVYRIGLNEVFFGKTFKGPNSSVTAIALGKNNTIVAGYRNGYISHFPLDPTQNNGIERIERKQKKRKRYSEPFLPSQSIEHDHDSLSLQLNCVADGFLFTNSDEIFTWEDTVCVWDESTAKRMGTFERHTKKITCVLQNDEHTFFSSSLDKTIRSFDHRNPSFEALACKAHSAGVTCLTKDGPFRLISGSNDRSVKVWDIRSLSEPLSEHHLHVSPIRALLCGWGRTISASDDRSIAIWKETINGFEHNAEVCLLPQNISNFYFFFSSVLKCTIRQFPVSR
jgi:WD40 repeat protein